MRTFAVVVNFYKKVLDVPVVLAHTDVISIGKTNFIYERPAVPPTLLLPAPPSPNLVSEREDDIPPAASSSSEEEEEEVAILTEAQQKQMRAMARVGQNSTTSSTSRFYKNMLPSTEKRDGGAKKE